MVIQAVTFLSQIVGGHQHSLSKKVTSSEALGSVELIVSKKLFLLTVKATLNLYINFIGF